MGFFAPKSAYAFSGIYGMAADEMKNMVRQLHRNGIEVILDVVFNHTAEMGPEAGSGTQEPVGPCQRKRNRVRPGQRARKGAHMVLLERDFLTVSDEGDKVWMTLDTSKEAVREVAAEMARIRPGLTMDGKGWEAFLSYYLEGNNPALLKDLVFASEGDLCRAWYKKISGFTKVKGVSLGNYILTLFGESREKGLYCVIRDEGDCIDWK